MASDYRAVIEHLDLADLVLVGHSMGAFLSVVFCLEHADVVRDRLRGLVLVGGNAGAVAKGSFQNRLQIPLFRYGVMEAVMRRRRLGRLFVRSLFGIPPSDELVEDIRAIMMKNHIPPTLTVLQAMIDDDHYGRLGEIEVATHVICGDADRTCPRWHSERLARDIRGAKATWIPRVGHMVGYEAPETIIAAVTELSAPRASASSAA